MKYRYREPHEMKDSGVEWLGMIPKEWEVKPHKYIMFKKKEICNKYSKENILSLTKKGIIVRDLENPSGKMPATFDGYQKIYKNNLLLCLFDIDVTPRCVGIIKENGLTSPAYSQFIIKDGSVNYYNYLLTKIDDEKSFLHLSKNLRNSLTEENFGIIKTIRPKVLEQQKIADFLDKKCEEFDSVIAKKEILINKLEEAKKSLISEVVTGKVKVIEKENGEYGIIKREAHEMKDSGIEWLGMIPKEWGTSKIKYIKSSEKNAFVDGPFGSNLKSEHYTENGDVYVIESGAVTSGKFLLKELKTISEEHFLTINRSECKQGDIIISKIGANYGMSGILPYLNKKSIVSGNSLKLTIDKQNNSIGFIHYTLLNLKKSGSFEIIMNSTAQPALSLGLLNDVKLTKPSLKEQIKISKYIGDKLFQFDITIGKQKESIEKLKLAKQSLISEAVTGKIEIL